jgi:tetratricopeptide (TPR) repeat protein
MFVPDRLKSNAFRVLRLSSEATLADVHRAAEDLRRAALLGTITANAEDVPTLGAIPNSEADIRAAVGRIENPGLRIIDRLFWFHSVNGTLVKKKSSIDHDLALREMFDSLCEDVDTACIQKWSKSLSSLRQIVADDGYWMLFGKLDVEGGFEPAAFSSEIDILRSRAVELAAEPLVIAGREAIERSNCEVARQILAILEELAGTDSWAQSAQLELVSPSIERVKTLRRCISEELRAKIVKTNDAAEQNKAVCTAELAHFRADVQRELRKLAQLLPSESESLKEAREEAALLLNTIAIYFTWASEFIETDKLRNEALVLAENTLAFIRIRSFLNESQFWRWRVERRQVEGLKSLCQRKIDEFNAVAGTDAKPTQAHFDAQLECFRTDVQPELNKLTQLLSAGSEDITEVREEAALLLENIAIGFTWVDDCFEAERLLQEALQLTENTATAARLQALLDEVQLDAQDGHSSRAIEHFRSVCQSINEELDAAYVVVDHSATEDKAIGTAELNRFRADVLPRLHNFMQLFPPNSESIREASEKAALTLDAIATYFTFAGEFIEAEKLIEEALKLIPDDENRHAAARESIQSSLEDIRASAQHQRVTLAIDRIQSLCRNITTELRARAIKTNDAARQNHAFCAAQLRRFRADVQPEMRKLAQSLPPESEAIERIREECALLLSETALYFTYLDDFIESESLLEEALELVENTPAAIRIRGFLEVVRPDAKDQRDREARKAAK